MSWIFGAGMGLFMGGPLGAVVGGVLEHMVTKNTRDMMMSSTTQTNQEAVFITNLAVIMTKVAMADGQISQRERAIIHSFFAHNLRYRGEELRYIDGIIRETEKVNPDISKICYTFRQNATPEMRMLLIDLTYQIAIADQIITEKEQIEIDLIAAQIGISQPEHNRIKYKYVSSQKSQRTDYYHILGLKQGASGDEIKKAYRQMASQYHPDKVSHLGRELVEFADKKFKEINEAYNALRKTKGF